MNMSMEYIYNSLSNVLYLAIENVSMICFAWNPQNLPEISSRNVILYTSAKLGTARYQ